MKMVGKKRTDNNSTQDGGRIQPLEGILAAVSLGTNYNRVGRMQGEQMAATRDNKNGDNRGK
jgi:hypothetical protein